MADKGTNTYRWDKYAKEGAVPDFVLEVDDKTTITITNPTGVQVMRLAEATRRGDVEAMLLAIAGDKYPELRNLLGKAGHGAMEPLLEDMMDHFGMYEDVELEGPGGGKVSERRPRKIKQLLKVGYRPVGEAQ